MDINLFKKFKKAKTDGGPETIDTPAGDGKKKKKGLFGFGSAKKFKADTRAAEDAANSVSSGGDGEATPKEPSVTVKTKKPVSPVTLGLVIFVILAGAGAYIFVQGRGVMKVKLKNPAKASMFKPGPGEGVGGITFGGDKPPEAATDTGIPSDPKAAGAGPVTAAGLTGLSNDAEPAPPSAQEIKFAQSPEEGEKTVVAPVSPGKIEQKGLGGGSSATAAGIPPKIPSPEPPPPSVQNDSAPTVATPVPVNEKLPVPIKLALKDEAPFKSRFEKKYADKMAARNPKGPGIKPGVPVITPGVPPKFDIKDLVGADGKPMAPGLAPGSLDINAIAAGGVPMEKISLYGVMVSGGRKTAITSRGEVQIGGMLYGEKIVDITPAGVKLKSGRMLQVASE